MNEILYKQLMTMVATIKKVQNQIENNNSSMDELQNKLFEELSKTNKDNESKLKDINLYINALDKKHSDKITKEKDNLLKLIQKEKDNIQELNKRLDKINVTKEINSSLKDYATSKELESISKEFKTLLDNITLKHGKDGKDGKNGINGLDGKNGIDGKDGSNGKDAETPTIEIQETETLHPSENASVEVTKENNTYKLKFKIPRGKNGSNGMISYQSNTDKIISQVIVDGYVQSSTMASGKVYTYVRDENNRIIETEVS